ncbi:hypothetical protein ACKZDW_03160 (plasmid) [Ralstonia syzygii subsp. celebesensis]
MRYEQPPGPGIGSTPILSVEGLRKRYGEQTVVDGLSFRSVADSASDCWAPTAQARPPRCACCSA